MTDSISLLMRLLLSRCLVPFISSAQVHFRVKPHTTMEKVLNAFCEKVGVRRDIVRLTFDGTRVQLDHTPAKLGLEDGDALDVMEQQVGGAC